MRLTLESAERLFKIVEAKYKIGNATLEDFLAARRDRDVAAADLKGDKLAAAPARLQCAEERLEFIEARFKAGFRQTEEDVLKAKRDRDVAAAEVSKIDQAPPPSIPPGKQRFAANEDERTKPRRAATSATSGVIFRLRIHLSWARIADYAVGGH